MLSVARKFTFDGHPIFNVGERSSGLRGQGGVQDYDTLKQQCLKSGSLFEDPEFTATDKSLMFSKPLDRHYEWLRPKEICNDPRFFVQGYSRFDVQQGNLGDCWLIAAAANLTQDTKLFFRVVPDDNSFVEKYAGIFHFRFWHFGKWVDVVVDDRLPTLQRKLIYMRSKENNEFWSALLEKAYAKLHGSYEALKGGLTCEALEDFTGGVTEMYELKEAPGNLFQIIEKGFERNSMMGCFIRRVPGVNEAVTPQGLIRGHAYSITKAQMVDIVTPNTTGKIPLLRIRNPWGNKAEWNGPWSDKSPEWGFILKQTKEEIVLTFDHDGEFWMSLCDFLKYFDAIDFCNLSPDCVSATGIKKNWKMSSFEGKWTEGISAGGCRNFLETFYRNPQYVITLEKADDDDDDGKCTVVVTLMQKNRRLRRNIFVDCLAIGLTIYKVSESDLAQKPLKMNFFKENTAVICSHTYKHLREVRCRFEFSPGHYLIVPSTFEPDKEGEFLIRVFSENCNSMEENDKQVGMGAIDSRITEKLPDICDIHQESYANEQLFMDIAGPNQEIGWQELKHILYLSMRDVSLTVTEPLEFSKDICRSMVAMLDLDHSGRLGMEEFRMLLNDIAKWTAVFQLYDRDNTNKLSAYELRDALASAGYQLNNHILNSLVYRYGSPDKTIAFDDFIMCSVKVKTMIEVFKEKDYNNTNQATFSMDEWVTKSMYS